MPLVAGPNGNTASLALARSTAASYAHGSIRKFKRATSFDPITTLFAWMVVIVIDLYAMKVSRDFLHWFIIPLSLCGVVLAHDCVNWFRRKMNLFDPVGIIGLLGFHFFFLTNLLQVGWDIWLIEPKLRAVDMRPWIGWISVMNLSCLLLYRYLRDPLAGKVGSKRSLWMVDPTRFQIAIVIGLVASAALQVVVYASWGGIYAYMIGVETLARAHGTDRGFVYTISESFPILLMMGYVIAARNQASLRTWPVLVGCVLAYFVLVMLFGGLRGSRANTIWSMFWAAGMVHFMVRPLSKKIIFTSLLVLTAFMYVYGFYKTGGTGAIQVLAGGADFEYLERKTGRSVYGLLVGDLARGELHAYVLKQLFNRELDYDLALGRTYYATMCRIVPSFVWPNRPPLKNLEGTEIQYGKGSFDPVNWSSSYAWGLGAEAMMNFGIIGVPIMYLLWTLLVGRIRKWVLSWDPRDTRLLLAPILVNLCFVALIGDSDNIFQFLFKNASVPFFFVWVVSRHMRLPSAMGNRAVTAIRNLRFPVPHSEKLGTSVQSP